MWKGLIEERVSLVQRVSPTGGNERIREAASKGSCFAVVRRTHGSESVSVLGVVRPGQVQSPSRFAGA